MRRWQILMALLLGMSTNSFVYGASDDALREQVQQLQASIKRLEDRIFELQRLVIQQGGLTGELESPVIWGCFLDDSRAGNLYANALTEAEAKVIVLNQCEQADGVCWSNNVSCRPSHR